MSPRWWHKSLLTSVPSQEQLTTIHGQGTTEEILKREQKKEIPEGKWSIAIKLNILNFLLNNPNGLWWTSVIIPTSSSVVDRWHTLISKGQLTSGIGVNSVLMWSGREEAGGRWQVKGKGASYTECFGDTWSSCSHPSTYTQESPTQPQLHFPRFQLPMANCGTKILKGESLTVPNLNIKHYHRCI